MLVDDIHKHKKSGTCSNQSITVWGWRRTEQQTKKYCHAYSSCTKFLMNDVYSFTTCVIYQSMDRAKVSFSLLSFAFWRLQVILVYRRSLYSPRRFIYKICYWLYLFLNPILSYFQHLVPMPYSKIAFFAQIIVVLTVWISTVISCSSNGLYFAMITLVAIVNRTLDATFFLKLL